MRLSVAALDEARLQRLVEGNPFVRDLRVFDEVASTNDELRTLAAQGAISGTVAVANGQRAGRGRLGRSWHSPPGVGVYVSVLLRPDRPVVRATRWILASALAACEACRGVAGCEVTIKWPNDLELAGKKLAGTLAEVRSRGGLCDELIIGTGFNANQKPSDFPVELAGRATSLRVGRDGRPVDRELLTSAYLERLGERVASLQRGRWETIRAEWTDLAPAATDAPVRVECAAPDAGGAPSFQGVTRGVDEAGALLVERDDGRVIAVHLGEAVTPLGS